METRTDSQHTKLIAIVRRYGLAVRFRALPLVLRLALRPKHRKKLIRLGTEYGGWWVPEDVLQVGRVAYCFGAGEDVSFDLELARRGLLVRVFDPTPRAVAFVEALTEVGADKLQFEAVGAWHTTGTVRFYAPRDEQNVSHSAVNLQKTSAYFDAPVERLSEIRSRHDDEAIAIIKLDIEGAEHTVLESMIADGIRPSVVCTEFDQPSPVRSVWRTIHRLREAGYTLEHIEAWNYTFTSDTRSSHLGL